MATTDIPATDGVDGLVFQKICKSFGGTRALNEVSMQVNRGEIVALLGENGAGKSTLIKILGGIHAADSGQILIDQQPYQHTPGKANVKQAVAFIHQDLGLIEWMSVAENMALAQGYMRRSRTGLINWRACERATLAALQRVGCQFSPTQRVSALTRAEKSLVAIARALAVECDFLVLDEPTASLPLSDVRSLFTVLQQLRSEGVGMIYVSHRLDEIFEIADRVVVLRDGEMVGARAVSQTYPEDLVNLIVGHKPKTFSKPALGGAALVLQADQLATETMGPVDLQVRAGEILGLVGLRGAGQEDVGRCLFGTEAYQGEVRLEGKLYQPNNPAEAMQAGVGLIPRDRLEEAVLQSLSIRENVFINPLALGRSLFSFLSTAKEAKLAADIGRKVGLRPNAPELSIESLSGGNQQKVIVGRWLEHPNKILIAEDPTAGVDVGAKSDIYALLSTALAQGVAVIIISTDFEEVATICNRALVFSRGKIVQDIAGEALSTESLIQAASVSASPASSAPLETNQGYTL